MKIIKTASYIKKSSSEMQLPLTLDTGEEIIVDVMYNIEGKNFPATREYPAEQAEVSILSVSYLGNDVSDKTIDQWDDIAYQIQEQLNEEEQGNMDFSNDNKFEERRLDQGDAL